MGIYSKDALKEITPELTVKKCSEIFDEFNFDSITERLALLEERQEKFGVYTGTFLINPYGLYKMFPDEFPYLKEAQHLSHLKSNGKGLSIEQCQASLFVEMFERLSIKLHEQKLLYSKEENIKSLSSDEYFTYLKENAPYLNDHFKDKKFGFKLRENEDNYIKVHDIIDDTEVYFPGTVLYDTMGTNGFTAGNSDEEAITGGIFEIVERYTQSLFCLNDIKATKIIYASVAEYFPELEDIIVKCSTYFDKFDIVDVSININGVQFYSYFVRTEYDKTGHKSFSSGGCHIDQRIALIRALSESIQSFNEDVQDAGKTITRQQGWGAFRMFSKYFIEKIYSDIDALPQISLIYDKISFSSIHEIYDKTISAFKNIFVINCTNENFNIPSYIIYIPELFSKTYIWPSLFHVGINMYKGTKIAENIEGIELLFFWDQELLDTKGENERIKSYLNIISRLGNEKLNSYVRLLYQGYENEITLEKIREVTALDNKDPDSFIFFNNAISENTDLDYIFVSYARIGCLGLCKSFKNNLTNEKLINEYIEKYSEFGKYLLHNGEYVRAAIIYKQLAEFSDNLEFNEKLEEIGQVIDGAMDLRSEIFDLAGPSIFEMSVGDEFENFTLKSIKQEGMFQFELQFENDASELNISIFTIEPDDYYSETKKGIYIDHLHGLLIKKEKKFLKKLIKRIDSL